MDRQTDTGDSKDCIASSSSSFLAFNSRLCREYVDHNLHSDRFWAICIVSGSVRLLIIN